jgi:peptidyl-prolyl cis-trans isomerase B (cyclophilin B)
MSFNIRFLPLILVGVLTLGVGACASSTTDSTADTNATEATTEVSEEVVAATPSEPEAGLPILEGTATIELMVNGSPIVIEVNGNDAPITAGNFRRPGQSWRLRRCDLLPGRARAPALRGARGRSSEYRSQRANSAVRNRQLCRSRHSIPLATSPWRSNPRDADEPIYSETFETAGLLSRLSLPHTRGAVAMLRSQAVRFCVSSVLHQSWRTPRSIDGSYAVFGYVTEGMDVVDNIQQGDKIESAQVLEGLDNLKTATAE